MTLNHPVGDAARDISGQESTPASGQARGIADWTPLDQRTAHLARALYADLDYVLGVDPNTLAAFCVWVLDEWDAGQQRASVDMTATDPDDSTYIVKGG